MKLALSETPKTGFLATRPISYKEIGKLQLHSASVFLRSKSFLFHFAIQKPSLISVFAIATNLMCGVFFSQIIKQERKIVLDHSTEF